MTTPPEILNFRPRPDAPLFPGIDPVAIRAEIAALGPRSLADLARERRAATVPPETEPERAPGSTTTRAAAQQAPGAPGETFAPGNATGAPTARQLRIAGRIARKLGVPAADDAAAVTALRARGIDPFDRGVLIGGPPTPAAAPDAPSPAPSPAPPTRSRGAAPGEAEPSSPVPAKAAATSPGAATSLATAAQEVGAIQRDIIRRRRRRMAALVLRLALLVALPTAGAWWYSAEIATPRYETRSEFVIQQAESQGSEGGLFQSGAPALQQDSVAVQSYLHSREAMLRLDADQGFRNHFEGPEIDPLLRLGPEASNEDVYALYGRMVKVAYDPTEGLLRMTVSATSPEASQGFSEALIAYAEEQVDRLTQRLRSGQMAGAEAAYDAAEARMRAAQAEVLALQEDLGVIDPASETGSLMTQITEFELQLRQRRLQLDQLTSVPAPNAARVAALEREIDRLEEMIAGMRGSMTEARGSGTSLARVSGQLQLAEAELETRRELLKQAAAQLEAARIQADRQVRYMAVGVAPIAPDEPTAPRVWAQTGLALAVFAGLYLLGSLTVSVLREQVTA